MKIEKAEYVNNFIGEMIKSDKVINYMRFGMGYETFIPYHIENNIPIDKNMVEKAWLHAGLYGNKDDYMAYYDEFIKSVKNRKIFLKWDVAWLNKYENYFLEKYDTETLYSEAGSNEAFRYKEPFSQYFKDKKILVVNNFTDSIEKQFVKRDKLFKSKKVLPKFDLLTYKSVSSFCFQKPHSGWKESYEVMKDDISKLDFDIALVGCASYSQPLVNFIYSEMNKTALNTAGGTPLYFGILGKRWKTDPFLKDVNIEHWISPPDSEKPKNFQHIEGGCYW